MDNLQKEIKQRLRKILDEMDKSIKDVSLDMKYTESKVKGLRSGNQFITPEIAIEFENMYFINASWLIFGRGDKFIPKLNIQSEPQNRISNEEILKKLEERENLIQEIKDETKLLKDALNL